jgi:[ribosomal protein S5]-alanine N-acetyltransferase
MKLMFLFALFVASPLLSMELNFALKNIKNCNAPEKFTTLRLDAHRIQEQDLNNLYLLLSNPEVAKTVIGGMHDLEKTKEVMTRLVNRWSTYGYGSYMFHDKSENFIGRVGLHPADIAGKEEIVLSYAIMPEYWNNGFATEISQALTKIGFEQLGFKSIVCFTQPTNKASQRVIEKSGFKYEKTILEKSGPYKDIELIFYRLIKQNN